MVPSMQGGKLSFSSIEGQDSGDRGVLKGRNLSAINLPLRGHFIHLSGGSILANRI